MTMKRRFFSAPTLTQALLTAARHHGVQPDDLVYQEIEKRQGFIKTPRGVVIEVDPEAPTAAAAPRPAQEPPAPDAAAQRPALSTQVEEAPEAPEAPSSEPDTAPAQDAEEKLSPVGEASAVRETEVPFVPAEDSGPQDHPGLTPVAPAAAREEPPPPPADEPAPTTEPAAAPSAVVVDEALRQAIAEAVDELAYLATLRVQVGRVDGEGDTLRVELEGPDGPRLVARGGRALLAMQHLLPRLLFGRLGRSVHCRLDCEGFHQARTERLGGLAQKAAERVRRGGRAWLLEPMAPDERRLVHLALAEEEDIATESVGQGFLKRVRVAQIDTDQA